MRSIFIVLLLSFCFTISNTTHIQAQGSYTDKIIHLNDGSKIKGKIVSRKQEESIVLRLSTGEEITLQLKDIRSINYLHQGNDGDDKKKGKYDKLYLRDGSRVYGKIIEYNENDFLNFQLKNGKEVIFQEKEIARIKHIKRSHRGYTQKESGYFVSFDVGMNIGQDNDFSLTQGQLSVQTILGHRFTPKAQVGLGFGLDYLAAFRSIPVFLSYGGELGKSKVTPIYFVNAGYSRMEERNVANRFGEDYNDLKGGFFMQVGSGLNFKYPNYSINLKLGYKIQNTSYEFNRIDFNGREWFRSDVERQFRRFNMSIGVSF